MIKHLKNVEKYDGSLKELAKDISNMTYDSLALFLSELSYKIEYDSKKDKERKRNKLSHQLESASKSIRESSEFISSAWNICKPFMKD